MAANHQIESAINDLVNFAVGQEVIPLDQAETFVRDLAAAYANGAPYRDDDETPDPDSLAFGFQRTQLPPIDKLERQFVWLRHKIEQDQARENNPLLELFEALEFAVLRAVDEREVAQRLTETPTGSMH